MAEYLILIYGEEAPWETAGEDFFKEISDGHTTFGEKNHEAIKGGNALQPTSTATSIRPNGASFDVTDGAFAETKEALGGYYLVEAADLDEAIGLAKQIPMPHGGVEVRPIMVFG
jgi:hypothetical protein